MFYRSRGSVVQHIKVLSWCQEEAQSSKKIEAEDIENMSDSNQDIKKRLSEAVRDNAKHLLDPNRKVNGEPVPAQQPQLFTGGVMRWYQIEGIEWLRVSPSHPPPSQLMSLLACCNLLEWTPSSWAFSRLSPFMTRVLPCVLSDAVGKWDQWDSGWWDGTGEDHPVHCPHCHDDRKKSHGPLPGGGPLVHPA